MPPPTPIVRLRVRELIDNDPKTKGRAITAIAVDIGLSPDTLRSMAHGANARVALASLEKIADYFEITDANEIFEISR